MIRLLICASVLGLLAVGVGYSQNASTVVPTPPPPYPTVPYPAYLPSQLSNQPYCGVNAEQTAGPCLPLIANGVVGGTSYNALYYSTTGGF